MSTIFQPLNFDCDPKDIPLNERLGLRDGVATFESQFHEGYPPDFGADLVFLRSLRLGKCAYGAADCKVHPLVVALDSDNPFRTGRDVLTALKARDFRSSHIASLEMTSIPFPGYHPSTENDEIHNDALEQHIFSRECDADASTLTHTLLKQHVVDGRLWYVLLHTTPKQYDEFMFSDYVVLFAVGHSLHGHHALGVVTHQVCHNLCD